MGENWWRTAVVYQIYPRSFVDGDGDGVGDLPGATSAMDHLARLGVDAVWLTPYYPSAGADGGYDVTDHRDVDPELGTLEDFDRLVAAAHRRGLRFHAWFNPYRIGVSDPAELVPDHPARRHPDWTFRYGGKLYYDPGVPAARRFVEDAIMDAVHRYDVDGVHLDDFFYPYPTGGEQLPDQETFRRYGTGFRTIEDWRRHNTDLLVSELDGRVHAARPGARFGISPFGIWRNATSDPAGSNTRGMESYSAIYADTRKWVRQGWVDYIAPQLYWQIGHPAADYAALVPWWSNTVAGTDVDLYIGQAAYKVGGQGWTDPGELSAHLSLNRRHPGVDGDIFFRATSLTTNAAEAMRRVVAEHYADSSR